MATEHYSYTSNQGNLPFPESWGKLVEDMHKPAKELGELIAEKMMVHKLSMRIGCINIIPTENYIKESEDISPEVEKHLVNISKDFVDLVLKPFSDGMLKFLKKHSEYKLNDLSTFAGVQSGVSFACEQEFDRYLHNLKGED